MCKVLFIAVLIFIIGRVDCFCQEETVINNDTISKDQLNYELLTFAYEGEAENIKLWIEKGADVNAVSDKGISALMYAAQKGNLLAVKVLVANGADINYRPYGEVSALTSAVINNKIEIADYLLHKNADANIRDDQKITPLIYAAAYGYLNMSRLLIKYKSDIHLKDEYGNDALMASVQYNHPEVSESLLQSGADINTADEKGFTPLMLASQNGWGWYVDLLNTNKTDFSLKNNYDNDALDIAIINHRPEIIQKLLSIDSTKCKFNGKPVKLSYLSGNRDLVKLLRKNGCKPCYLPIFDKISMGYGVDMNFKDIMLGFSLGLRETRYNFLVSVSHYSRYWAKRTLVNYGNDIYYQFWERRSWLAFGLDKRIKLSGMGNKQNGLSAGFAEGFTYGHYRGSEIYPARQWIPVPRLGFYTEGKSGGLSVSLEYIDFNVENIPLLRVNANAYIFIGLKKFTSFKKMPEW